MDGDARLADRASCSNGRGVQITAREELVEIVRAGVRARLAGGACTRSATRPTTTRSTPSRRRATNGRRSASVTGSSTRRCLLPRTSSGSRALGVAASVPVQPCTVGPRPGRARLGGRDASRLRLALAPRRRRLRRNGSDAPIEELDPLAGIVRRRPADARRSAGMASRAGRHRRGGVRRDLRQSGVARRRRAAPGEAPPGLPRRPRRARPRSVRHRPGGAAGGAGRGDDGRRPLGSRPAALGLSDATPQPFRAESGG